MPKEVTDPKKKKFLEKHPILTNEQVKQKQLEAKMAKAKYSQDMKEIEQNLIGYLEISEPLVDPETDKVLCWMRLPTMMLLEDYYKQFGKTTKKYEELSDDEKFDYANRQYVLMSKIISIPEHDAKWWKSHSNLRFLKLFSLKLEQLFDELEVASENF